MKIIFVIAAFVLLIFVKNLAFWSKSQTFIFGDTAIYSLHLATLANNLDRILSPKDTILGWNPNFLAVGLPSLSVVDLGWLYPPNLIIVAIARISGDSLNVFPLYIFSILLHLIFSSFFVYKILNGIWKLNRFSSLIGALIWSFNGFNLEFSGAAPIMIAGSYLPLCVYLTLREGQRPAIGRNFFFFFLALAFSFLIGYPMVTIVIYALCLSLKFFTLEVFEKKSVFRLLYYHLKGFFLVTFPIILPLYLGSYALLGYTTRSFLSLEGFLSNPAPLLNLTEPFIPKNTLFNTLNATNSVLLYFSLVGIIILFQSRFKSNFLSDRKNIALLTIGLIGLILSFGGLTFLPSLIYFLLPVLNVFRRLSVFTIIPSFAFSLLGAQAVSSALENKKLSKVSIFWIGFLAILLIYTQVLSTLYSNSTQAENPFNHIYLYQSLFLSAVITGLTFFALLQPLTERRLAQSLLILVLLTEAGTSTFSKMPLNSKIDPHQIFKANAPIKTLQKLTSPMERVDVLYTQHSYNTDYLDLEQTQGYLSLASRYGVEIIEAFTAADYQKKNLRSLLGIKYLVKKETSEEPNLKKIAEFYQDEKKTNFYAFNNVTREWEGEPWGTKYILYQNPDVLPRVFLAVGVKETKESSPIILKAIEKLDDPRIVFIPPQKLITGDLDSNGEVTVESYRRNYLKVKTKTSKPSFLVNTTANYPGWKVKVNDQEKEIIPTDWFAMGTYLPAGENIVEFSYLSKELINALYYGAFATLIWLLFIGWKVIVRKK